MTDQQTGKKLARISFFEKLEQLCLTVDLMQDQIRGLQRRVHLWGALQTLAAAIASLAAALVARALGW